MERSVRVLLVSMATVAALVVSVGPISAAPVGEGMLTAKDVGLAVMSKPHTSTVIAYELVESGSCAASSDVEHEARVVSFGTDAGGTGPALNQVVYDFASKSEAVGFFADVRASDQARADCGATQKATDLAVAKGPKGLGDDRFTVTSKELIGGKSRSVRAFSIREGDAVTKLIFLDWPSGGSAKQVTKVAKEAVARIAAG